MLRTALAVVVWLMAFNSIGYAMPLEPKCIYERDDIENPPYQTIHFEESAWGVREWLRRDCWVELHGCRGRTDSIKIGMEFRHLGGNPMGNRSPPSIEGHVAIYDGSTYTGEGWVLPGYAWAGNDIALSVEIPVNPDLAGKDSRMLRRCGLGITISGLMGSLSSLQCLFSLSVSHCLVHSFCMG